MDGLIAALAGYNHRVVRPPPPKPKPAAKPALAGHPTRPDSMHPHDHESVPKVRARPGVPLGKGEAFLLSKVDGKRTVSDLAVLVGLSPREVVTILKRLVQVGAMELQSPTTALLELDEGWEDAPVSTTGPGVFDQATMPGWDPTKDQG